MLTFVSPVIYNTSSFQQLYRLYQGTIINTVLKGKSSSDEVHISTDTRINCGQEFKESIIDMLKTLIEKIDNMHGLKGGFNSVRNIRHPGQHKDYLQHSLRRK